MAIGSAAVVVAAGGPELCGELPAVVPQLIRLAVIAANKNVPTRCRAMSITSVINEGAGLPA
jgi:hypothetical protein